VRGIGCVDEGDAAAVHVYHCCTGKTQGGAQRWMCVNLCICV